VKKLEPSHIAGRNVQMHIPGASDLENSLAVLKGLNIGLRHGLSGRTSVQQVEDPEYCQKNFKRLNIEYPCDPKFSFQGIFPKELKT
jgi:hypothetical protein